MKMNYYYSKIKNTQIKINPTYFPNNNNSLFELKRKIFVRNDCKSLFLSVKVNIPFGNDVIGCEPLSS